MNYTDAVNAIYDGSFDEGMDELVTALNYRRNYLQQRRTQNMMRELKPGDRVQVSGNIKPKYMIGQRGIVLSKLQSKVLIEFDYANGRFGTRVRVPATCLTRID